MRLVVASLQFAGDLAMSVWRGAGVQVAVRGTDGSMAGGS